MKGSPGTAPPGTRLLQRLRRLEAGPAGADLHPAEWRGILACHGDSGLIQTGDLARGAPGYRGRINKQVAEGCE